ncbi:uncharacterized protein BDR25DRAFT_353545 [Lindgomyces ingoldianus]|uniref:Uncharacterized protein n=1 Tax=Lindgomyces ingoldianus TaxID=673940 RepID=A0ACB6QZV8_9PLEO|nr:uncharacterized protein BDR25DRAFT_353545 [Lindgomyces ingoldianus]KAF2472529.1 hypothetical protein BDR25DRAFT_353545 [Lindgomyces ingoldianus]
MFHLMEYGAAIYITYSEPILPLYTCTPTTLSNAAQLGQLKFQKVRWSIAGKYLDIFLQAVGVALDSSSRTEAALSYYGGSVKNTILIFQGHLYYHSIELLCTNFRRFSTISEIFKVRNKHEAMLGEGEVIVSTTKGAEATLLFWYSVPLNLKYLLQYNLFPGGDPPWLRISWV